MRPARSIPVAALLRIALMVALLVAVVILQRRCGVAVNQLFRALDASGDGGARR